MNIPLNSTFFNSLHIIFFSSRGDMRKSFSLDYTHSPFFPPTSSFINLLILFVIMSENTFTQMESPLLKDQSGVPAERLYKTCHPVSCSRLWSSFPSVIRSQAWALWKKTATGDWQPTTGFMAVVSGGRQVSRMDDCQRDFTLPSCALTHTVLLLPCSRWLIFTAVCLCSSDGAAANNKGDISAVKYYVNIIKNAEGSTACYECCLFSFWSAQSHCSFLWKLQEIKTGITIASVRYSPDYNNEPLNELICSHTVGLVMHCLCITVLKHYLHFTVLLV